jgi:hypothetical protein
MSLIFKIDAFKARHYVALFQKLLTRYKMVVHLLVALTVFHQIKTSLSYVLLGFYSINTKSMVHSNFPARREA